MKAGTDERMNSGKTDGCDGVVTRLGSLGIYVCCKRMKNGYSVKTRFIWP